VLRILIALKNPSPQPSLNPRNLGSMASTLTTTPLSRLRHKILFVSYNKVMQCLVWMVFWQIYLQVLSSSSSSFFSIRSIETCYGRYKTESFHLFKGIPKFLFPFGWYFRIASLVISLKSAYSPPKSLRALQ
jgi:hypothetical protein